MLFLRLALYMLSKLCRQVFQPDFRPVVVQMDADIFISASHQIICANSQKWPLLLEKNIHNKKLILFNSKFLGIK